MGNGSELRNISIGVVVVRWGERMIAGSPPCEMLVTSQERLEGFCTRSGHCWAAFRTKLFHPACRSRLSLVTREKKTLRA